MTPPLLPCFPDSRSPSFLNPFTFNRPIPRARRRHAAESIPATPVLPEWSKLLVDAVREHGIISSAYHRFWNYSVGNQLLVLFQCTLRQLDPGPINTYLGWKELGRSVVKGEKALTLCMPVTCKKKVEVPPDREAEDEESIYTRFVYRPHWFLLSQTTGKEYVPQELPEWSEARALRKLEIDRVVFDYLNGNAQGFARQRQVSVSPIAFAPTGRSSMSSGTWSSVTRLRRNSAMARSRIGTCGKSRRSAWP